MVRFSRDIAIWPLSAWVMAMPFQVSAQSVEAEEEPPSREVVQPLPRAAAGDLTQALMQISADPTNVEALLQAGRASHSLEDFDAAIGFFARARDLGTAGGRARAGLAAALVYKKMPVEALRLFALAESEGARLDDYAGDFGLALDLVGDNVRAQSYYRIALSQDDDPVITRRLALSQAIGGDQSASEYTLLPLLQRQDLASYRSRAFALAALGKTEEAVAIAEAIMPASLAARIAPYLRYMPNLTRAQQAAAANFGHFPEASSIGVDDPRIAEYSRSASSGSVVSNAADGRLVPVGEPLGPVGQIVDAGEPPPAAQPPPVVEEEPVQAEVAEEDYTGPVGQILAQTDANSAAIGEELPPVDPAMDEAIFEDPVPAREAADEAVEEALVEELPTGEAGEEPTVEDIETAISDAEFGTPEESLEEEIDLPQPGFSISPAEMAQEQADPDVEGEFDLGSVSGSRTGRIFPGDEGASDGAGPPPAELTETEADAVEPPVEQDLADAFAEFGGPEGPGRPAPGAVDVTSITPASPEAEEAAEPEHPSRIWVQVATGRDRSALAFDWRRITRNSAEQFEGREGFLVRWGRTNRLVTGPFETREAALDYVNELDDAGVDSFMFTSDDGEEVEPLPGG